MVRRAVFDVRRESAFRDRELDLPTGPMAPRFRRGSPNLCLMWTLGLSPSPCQDKMSLSATSILPVLHHRPYILGGDAYGRILQSPQPTLRYPMVYLAGTGVQAVSRLVYVEQVQSGDHFLRGQRIRHILAVRVAHG